jgi:hypothetical protein
MQQISQYWADNKHLITTAKMLSLFSLSLFPYHCFSLVNKLILVFNPFSNIGIFLTEKWLQADI